MRISDWSSDVCSSDLRVPSPWETPPAKTAVYYARPLPSARTGIRWPQWPGGLAWRKGNAGRSTEQVSNTYADVTLVPLAGKLNLLLASPEAPPLLFGMRTLGMGRSDECRVGKECNSTGSYRW